jgi:integrase
MTARRRRGAGEGTVYRRKDGKWVAELDLGWIDGKRRRRQAYARTQREALAKLTELRRAADRGQNLAAAPQTVAEWLAHWLTEVKARDGTRPSTLRRYREVVDGHLVPVLGKVRLDKLAPLDVERLLAARRDSVSPATLVKIHAVLRVALADAERRDRVARNVARSVRAPALAEEERRALTVEEAKKLLAAAVGDRYETVFVLGLTMGLRRGEVLGLRWDDVNLDTRTLRVQRALQRVSGELRLVEPKTRSSRRPLPILLLAVKALEKHRTHQDEERRAAGDGWQPTGLVFTTRVGGPIEPRNLNRRFEELRRRVDLPWLRLHDLRHACATFLLAHGVDPRTVMEILGHTTIRQTMDRYGHALPERMRAAADAMDVALDDASDGAEQQGQDAD